MSILASVCTIRWRRFLWDRRPGSNRSSTATVILCNGHLLQRLSTATVIHCNGWSSNAAVKSIPCEGTIKQRNMHPEGTSSSIGQGHEVIHTTKVPAALGKAMKLCMEAPSCIGQGHEVIPELRKETKKKKKKNTNNGFSSLG